MDKWTMLINTIIYLLFALLCKDNKDAVVVFSTAALVMAGIFASLIFTKGKQP